MMDHVISPGSHRYSVKFDVTTANRLCCGLHANARMGVLKITLTAKQSRLTSHTQRIEARLFSFIATKRSSCENSTEWIPKSFTLDLPINQRNDMHSRAIVGVGMAAVGTPVSVSKK